MKCPQSGQECPKQDSNNPTTKPTHEHKLEERIKILEQENANLRAQLFNTRAASKPYGEY
jgi:hypothetical protein